MGGGGTRHRQEKAQDVSLRCKKTPKTKSGNKEESHILIKVHVLLVHSHAKVRPLSEWIQWRCFEWNKRMAYACLIKKQLLLD